MSRLRVPPARIGGGGIGAALAGPRTRSGRFYHAAKRAPGAAHGVGRGGFGAPDAGRGRREEDGEAARSAGGLVPP
ncbi:hypothetical protein C6V07_19565 [Burkholderia gladioli]|nr:hypothetical protein C6V07_19565 [Burkholderia gladioli]